MLPDLSRIRRALVIQLRAIGDVVQTTSVLPVLKNHLPASQIDFLTTPSIAGLLKGLSELNEVLVFPYSPKDLLGVLKFLPEIRRRHYDLIIDYQISPGTAILTRFSGAGIRLGWKMDRRQWAYTHISAANRKPEYVAAQKCRALSALGIEEISRATRVAISAGEIERVRVFFKERNVKKTSLLVNITPLGKRQSRQWMPEKIARLSDLLIEKYSARVFYNYAPGEKEAVESIAALSRGKVELLPEWPLATFAAFLFRVDLHFSYDNGPKHLAIACGTPTLTLFATDPPLLWNPLNDPEHPHILADVPCRFCTLRNCNLMICMKQIEPEDVLAKLVAMPALQSKLKMPANTV